MIFDSTRRDLRFALRQLLHAPAFTAAALVSLALGIGDAVTMFSAFHAVFLEQLPYRDAEQLASLTKTSPHDRNIGTRRADLTFLRENARSFSGLAAYEGFDSRTLIGEGEPTNLVVTLVSGDLFPLLGSTALLGRALGPEDVRDASFNPIVLSYRIWQNVFHGDKTVIGRQVILNRERSVIVGIMGPNFQFPQPLTQAWLPDRTPVTDPFQSSVTILARLKPGVGVEQARQEIEQLAPALASSYPAGGREWKMTIAAILGRDNATLRTPFRLLLAAVSLLMLIACLNVSNLLLARGSAREGEFALRRALGAERGQVIRQVLTESLLFAGLGGILGTALAYAGNRVLVHALPRTVRVPRLELSRLNGEVLLMAIAAAVASGLLFGIFPALALSRKSQPDSTARATKSWARRMGALMAGEVCLALILLAGSVLMIRSFVHLANIDPGFRTAHVLTASLPPNRTGRLKQSELMERYGAMLDAAQRIPGVESVALTSAVPLGRIAVAIDFHLPERSRDEYRAQYHAISQEYFSVMGIPLKRGRFFDGRDTGSTHVVIVNETMAHQYWPDVNPIGQHLDDPPLTIVGIVGNTRFLDLSGEPVPEIYQPYQQYFGPAVGAAIVVRTFGDPTSVTGALRTAIHNFDAEQVVEDVSTLEDLVSGSVGRNRFYTALMATFAALALVLTLIGIYGVAAYAVDRRARELGIRMAIGAERAGLIAMILRQGFASVVVGLATGVAGAWMLARFMSSLVYGIPVRDPVSLGLAIAILAAGALAAYLGPTLRITRLDPAAVLRHE